MEKIQLIKKIQDTIIQKTVNMMTKIMIKNITIITKIGGVDLAQ